MILRFHTVTVARYLYILILALIFIRCHKSPTEQPLPITYTIPEMRYIEADDRYFTMGSLDAWADDEEKPPMRVGFSYDYWIDTAEVTVDRFYQTTGYLPKEYGSADTALQTPIRYITWFDALLFCNQRSFLAGLDTVYSYGSYEKTGDGRVYRMYGLEADLHAIGYRLPTEAEWEFAARGGVNAVFPWGDTVDVDAAERIAWFGLNAYDTVQTVCMLEPNGYSLYDMFGNVMEWVHDARGYFSSDTVVNFTGPKFNSREERPVKGGGYIHTIEKLRASSRTDVYATLSSTATEYIGFRCCVGEVPATIGSVTGSTADDSINPVRLITGNSAGLLPSRRAKIVFVNKTRNNKHLCYCDFGKSTPTISCFPDFSPVCVPTVSPDGQWVAFSTQDEGFSEGSAIYIRRLAIADTVLHKLDDEPAFIPRWWVDSVSGDTMLVYTTSAVNNSTAEWGTSHTKMQKIAGGLPIGDPVVLEESGSFHAGLSANKEYLATGYTSLLMKHLPTGEVKRLFTAPQNGKPAGDSSQVCNVSITPDKTACDRVLFLDFGSGSTPSTLTGSTYFTHEIMFVADFSGKVIAWYRCPESVVQWGYPEWSSHPDYAVATAMPLEAPQSNRDIYLINLRDTVYTRLIEGVELRHPYLWVSDLTIDASLATDSAGFYNDPPTRDSQANFAMKMAQFWECHDSIEILCLGSSHIQSAVVPDILNPLYTLNMGYASGGLSGIRNILNNYAFSYCPKLKVVIVSMDISWYNRPDGEDFWDLISSSKGYRYDEVNDFWKAGLPEGFVSLVRIAGNPFDSLISANRGWVGSAALGWGADPPAYTNEWMWEFDKNCTDNCNFIDTLANVFEERDLQLIGIVLPMSPAYKNTPVYGRYGPTHAAAETLVNTIAAIDSQRTAFHFYDLHNYGDHSFTDDDANNVDHLSATGAIKVTTWLKTVVDSLLKEE